MSQPEWNDRVAGSAFRGPSIDVKPLNRIMISYRVPETGHKSKVGDGSVLRLRDALRGLGYDIFVGEESIEGGQNWMEEIAKAMKNAIVIIVMSSPTYGHTEWTKRECEYAVAKSMKILPVWHSGEFPTEPVDFVLAGLQRVPRGKDSFLATDFTTFLRELSEALHLKGARPHLNNATMAGAAYYLHDARTLARKKEISVPKKAVSSLAAEVTNDMVDDVNKEYKQLAAMCMRLVGGNFCSVGDFKRMLAGMDLQSWMAFNNLSTLESPTSTQRPSSSPDQRSKSPTRAQRPSSSPDRRGKSPTRRRRPVYFLPPKLVEAAAAAHVVPQQKKEKAKEEVAK
eukprot:gene6180-2796_t